MAVYKNSIPFGSIVTDGLILNLDATNINSYPGSGTTWTDTSGYNNSGSLINGPTFLRERGRGSIVFDGVDDYVIGNTPGNLNLAQPSSITTWVYFNNFTQINPRIIEIQDNSYSVQIIRDGLTTRLATKNSSFQEGVISTTWPVPITNTWYNISVVWIPSTLSTLLYLNGVLQSSNSTTPVAPGNQTNKYVLGVRSDFNSTTWLNGNISLTQIYNKALSTQEVQQNYNALKSRFGL
jgi:hypothetical protein